MQLRFIIVLSLQVSCVVTALKAETLELATVPFFEQVLPTARISGSLVTGVQQQGPAGEVVSMQASIPSTWAGDAVCARVVSVDGLYEARNEYRVSNDWQGGVAELPYPTTHGQLMSEVVQDEISIRISKGTCEGLAEDVILAVWNGGNSEPPTLLLNSFQAEAVFAYVGESTVPVRCSALTLDGKSAFDTGCSLDGFSASGATNVQILRIVNGNAAPQTSITIWFPES